MVERHTRLFLADLWAMVHSTSPYRIGNIDFSDDLEAIFQKSGQSMMAACRILRDHRMFQAWFHKNAPAVTAAYST